MEKNRITTQFSHKVTIVSFILAVFVMYIHAKNTWQQIMKEDDYERSDRYTHY